jgi:hypothetical protein
LMLQLVLSVRLWMSSCLERRKNRGAGLDICFWLTRNRV